MRFLEGAGARGSLELVGDELLELIRSGVRPEQIALVAPSVDAWRGPLETVLGALDVPYAVESRVRLGATPIGHALLQLLRYAWGDAGRRELFAFLRSPYSGLARSSVDYVEGRLRGRAIHTPARVEEEAEKLREAPVPALAELRAAEDPVEAIRVQLRAMLRAAYGTEAPPAGEVSRLDLRAYGHVLQLLTELGRLEATRDEVIAALERCEVRLSSAGEAGPRRRARSDARAHAALRGRVRARPRGGIAAAALAHVAVPRRRPAARARRAARASRPGLARPLSLLHRVHARRPPAVPRARGGDRRGDAARAEPVLGGGRGGVRP